MTPPNQKITSEWEGLRGHIGGWYLSSPLRRVSELLVLGDLRRRYLERLDALITGKETVLDVGAGSGYFSIPIAERLKQGKVISLDLSPAMLMHLKRRAKKKKLGDRIEARLGNAYQLDVKGSSVDIATANGVFHELTAPSQALDEIKRVLKPGGFAVISDFRDTYLGKKIAAAHREGDHGPFSTQELKGLLIDAGLLDVNVDVIRHWVLAIGRK